MLTCGKRLAQLSLYTYHIPVLVPHASTHHITTTPTIPAGSDMFFPNIPLEKNQVTHELILPSVISNLPPHHTYTHAQA